MLTPFRSSLRRTHSTNMADAEAEAAPPAEAKAEEAAAPDAAAESKEEAPAEARTSISVRAFDGCRSVL